VGTDIIIQAGGGVWGHPDGGRAGAAALRQAIEIGMTGGDLEAYARDHKELQRAIEMWGVATFK
jgi:ribulose-bisphosphate carboxylase large chain